MKKTIQNRAGNAREFAGVEWLQGSKSLPNTLLARVREGLLPMLLIPRVRVRSVEERGLSAIELFLLKSYLRDSKLTFEEVEMATGIPIGPLQVVFNRLAKSLLSSGVVEGAARRNALEKAVETGSCPEEVESTRDFIFLPRTGDLGVLSDTHFRRLERIRPHCMAPVPPEIVAKDTAEVLALTRNCSRLGWTIVNVEKPKTMPKRCPAYCFAGEVENRGEFQLWLSFENAGQNNSKHDFSFAIGLVEELTELSQSIPAQEKVIIATQPYISRDDAPDMPASPKITGPSRYSMPMPMSAIQSLMPNDLLVNPASLAVRWETPKAVVTMDYEVRFRPASERETAAFATDKVVQQICAWESDPNKSIERWIGEAAEEFAAHANEVTKERVVDRLWEVREFARAYSLQREGIFDYDQPDRHRRT